MTPPFPRDFRVACDGHFLIGDVLAAEHAPSLLVLHGAGQSCRERFRQLREYLLEHGVGSIAFDCIGHGDTGGELRSSSLKSRTEQACAVIEAVSLPQPFSVLAGSMGGYTAVTLLARYRIANLILIGPAMYTAQAYATPFNQGFTEIIRRPDSWEHSDAWGLLAGFTGRLLVIAGEKDTVIPPGVIRNVYESARNASERTLHVAAGASHLIITDLRARDPDQLTHVLGLMTRTLQGTGRGTGTQRRGGAEAKRRRGAGGQGGTGV